MDIMMKLTNKELNQISNVFLQNKRMGGKGLSLEEFVVVMMANLHAGNSEKETQYVAYLLELFEQIDINGDGTLEWHEFTGYCVEAGLVSTRQSEAPVTHSYMHDLSYTDHTSMGDYVRDILFVPKTDLIYVCEAKSRVLKVYDMHMDLKRTLDVNLTRSLRRDLLDVPPNNRGGSNAELMSTVFIEDRKYLVILATDNIISIWDIESLTIVHKLITSCTQSKAVWSPHFQMLFSCGGNTILCWSLEDMQLQDRMVGHADTILDILVLDEYELLLSASLDRRIILWDLTTWKMRGELVGHETGVRSLAYSPQHDMLISAGFDYDAFGWDVGSRTTLVAFKGHHAPLVKAVIVQLQTEHCVTADESGVFRLWDIRRNLSNYGGNAVCIQTFFPTSELSRFKPLSMAAVHDANIIAAGSHMHRFKCKRVEIVESSPVAALFNPTSSTFVTVTGHKITVWNAKDGSIRNQFSKVGAAENTCCCLDDRQRKILVGNAAGEVRVYNYLNGAYMKALSVSHTKSVVDVMYNNEDKCVITTSWDRRIRIFDENPPEHLELMRTMEKCHDRDISCSAFSRDLGLIATGSPDFSVRLFDFQFAKLLGILNGHKAEVIKLAFLDPFPILVSIDCVGSMRFWAAKGRFRCICFMQSLGAVADDEYTSTEESSTFLTEAAPDEETQKLVPRPLLSLSVNIDVAAEKYTLLTGDVNGVIKIYDIQDIIIKSGFSPLAKSEMVPNGIGYNVHRRVTHVIDPQKFKQRSVINSMNSNARKNSLFTAPNSSLGRKRSSKDSRRSRNKALLSSDTPETSPLPTHKRKGTIVLDSSLIDRANKMSRFRRPVRSGISKTGYVDLQPFLEIQAHTDGIHILHYIKANDTILSASYDNLVRLWNMKGELLGVLDPVNVLDDDPPPWKFYFDTSENEAKKLAKGKELLRIVKEHRKAEAEKLYKKRHDVEVAMHEEATLDEEEKEAETYHSRLEKRRQGLAFLTLQDEKARAEKTRKLYDNILSRLRGAEYFIDIPTDNDIKYDVDASLKESLEYTATKPLTHSVSEPTLRPSKEKLAIFKNIDSKYSYLHGEYDKKKSTLKSIYTEKVDTRPSDFLVTSFEEKRVKLPNLLSSSKADDGFKKRYSLFEESESEEEEEEEDKSVTMLPAVPLSSRPLYSLPGVKTELDRFGVMSRFRSSTDSNSSIKAAEKLTTAKIRRTSNFLDKVDNLSHLALSPKAPKRERLISLDEDSVMSEDDALVSVSPINSRPVIAKMNRDRIQEIVRKVSLIITPGKQKRKTKSFTSPMTTTRKKKRHRTLRQQHFGPYTLKEVLVLKEMFDSFDVDQNGAVDLEEFINSPIFKGSHLVANADRMFDAVDKDKSGEITMEELFSTYFRYASKKDLNQMLQYVTQKKKRRKKVVELTKAQLQEMRDMFNLYDSDKSGTISLAEIMAIMTQKDKDGKPIVSDDELRFIMDTYDLDKNQELDFEEFIDLLREN